MTRSVKYLLDLLPVIVTASGWLLAAWAFDYFGCTGNIKDMQPCYAGSFNLLPFLGIGLFWCQILVWVMAPVSLWLVFKVYVSGQDASGRTAA